jgi:hypothetical protein
MRFYNQQHRFYAGGDLHASATQRAGSVRNGAKVRLLSFRLGQAASGGSPNANHPGAEVLSKRSIASWSNTARRRKEFVRDEGAYLDFRGHITVRRL